MTLAQHEYTPGSDTDFAELYRETYPRLVRSLGLMLGSWAEAEDCVQDAYARAYRAWPRWKPDAPAEAWLWRIAINVAHNHLAQRKRRTVTELLRRFGKPQDAADPAGFVVRADLAAAMRRLKPREVSVMVLRHLHGYSNVEIAGYVGVDVRTVTRLLGSAAQSLRRDLGDAWRTATPAAAVEGVE